MSVRHKKQETYDKYCCDGRESMEVFDREDIENIGDEGYECTFKGKVIAM